VIIATERARRPGNFVDRITDGHDSNGDRCRFCHHEGPVVSMVSRPHHARTEGQPWDVAVVPFQTSFLQTNIEFKRTKHGLYDVMSGFGVHEVVIETPDHVANMADLDQAQIQVVIETYAQRIHALEKNSYFQFVMVFKNYGEIAGSRNIGHARSHIVATPVNPLHMKQKLRGTRDYYAAHKACIYCDLIQEELRQKSRIILETPHFLAVAPFAARFLFEIWILPKKHSCDFTTGIVGCEEDLAYVLKTLLVKFKEGLDDPAYNFYLQTAPFRRPDPDYKRWENLDKDFHWHIELMPRLTRIAGFEKGTGFYISAVPPESMAEYLREIEFK
ncbi:MAG: galactose-1-phosphate uridylyltransferase, partial [Candidatus Omnitrophota bacterium]|nr:galactose-1-phosphate uridylyltransferase [Candidatus Omnitrophota bacterium]